MCENGGEYNCPHCDGVNYISSDIDEVGDLRIGCAALRLDGGEVVSLPRPARHHDIIRFLIDRCDTPEAIAHAAQGFMTECGSFVGREGALYIAERAEQISRKTGGLGCHQLFSEDLW